MQGINIPLEVYEICKTIQAKTGYGAWLVGGCVRDSILKIHPHDFDIASGATPEIIKETFTDSKFKVIPTGIQYGIVTLVGLKGSYEVATFRKETNYTDGRRPDSVVFGTNLRDDLSRRDFTMNAIAYNPVSCEYFDPFNGIEDIQRRIIRPVGNARERFLEDGLRVLRAFRFRATLGFTFDQSIWDFIYDNDGVTALSALNNVSWERKRDELVKLLNGEHCREISRLDACNLSITFGRTFKQCLSSLIFDDNRSILELQKMTGIEEKLAYILNADSPVINRVLNKLRFDSRTIKDVVSICSVTKILNRFCTDETGEVTQEKKVLMKKLASKFGIRNVYRGINVLSKDCNMRLKANNLAECLNEALMNKECYTLRDLRINGRTLMAIGFQGEKIGLALNELLDMVIHYPLLNYRDILIDIATKIYHGGRDFV